MTSAGHLEARLVDSSDGPRSWWQRPVVKIALVATAVVTIGVAGCLFMAEFHGEAPMPTEASMIQSPKSVPELLKPAEASLKTKHPKSVPELLKLYPKLVSIKHVNQLFERLPAHNLEDMVYQHIKPFTKELFLSFLHYFGTTAPHFKTGKRLKRRHMLEDKAEFIYRLGVFENIIRDVIRLNNFEARHSTRPDRAVFAVTKFSDWTWAEFQTLLKRPASKLNTTEAAQKWKAKANSNVKSEATAPCTKNWAAEYPTVFTPRNQGACGSCYAHAAAEEIRALAFINTNVDPGELSVQYIIDCGGNGCSGGDAGDVMEWVNTKGGIPRKIDYGLYHESAMTCKSGYSNAVTTTGAERFYAEEDTALKLCADGPLSMGLYANDAFQSYHSGVLSGASCQSSYPNHDTQVVGVIQEKNAFLVRNSWGDDWGISPSTLEPGSNAGFILMEYGQNTCDITDCNSFPKDVSCIGDCNDHPTPVPTPPPTPMPEGYICGNSCTYADDGACDDGGAGANFDLCYLGTDCDDCGGRPPAATTPPPAPAPPTPKPPPGELCDDTCRYGSDTACDDGGPGSSYDMCAYGSDCADCGPRNPSSDCNDSCRWANDGECDEPAYCVPGSDCTDCQR